MVIDVVNRIPGHSVSVHWRGQWQKETPVMDGAPMVTQCPILPHTTFQYKFRAAQAGTHWWQILSGKIIKFIRILELNIMYIIICPISIIYLFNSIQLKKKKQKTKFFVSMFDFNNRFL